MGYQWDPKKAAINLKSHGVDFADAVGVLEDDWALTIDEQEVGGEQRFVTIGMDFLARVLVVVYTYRRRGYSLDLRAAGNQTGTENL